MKRHRFCFLFSVFFFLFLHCGAMEERGVPFYKKYNAKDYNANDQNFDVVCGDYGTVFIANFEGLLCYDGSRWMKILTPGVSRVTRLAKAKDGRIWIGGYNVFGYLQATANGSLRIKPLLSDLKSNNKLEVDQIKILGSNVYVHATSTAGEKIFMVGENDRLVEIRKVPQGVDLRPQDIRLPKGLILPKTLEEMVVNSVSTNGKNIMWGSTLSGVFSMECNSPYTHFAEDEGLKGKVYGIGSVGNAIYICTQDGLFRLYGGSITKVREIKFACWDLYEYKDRLLASTSQGLYIISKGGIKKLTDASTLCAVVDTRTNEIITGEVGGMFRIAWNGRRTKLSDLDKVLYSQIEGNKLTVMTIYRDEWQIVLNDDGSRKSQKCLRKQADPDKPLMTYVDRFGRTWKTDADGHNLTATDAGAWKYWIYPLTQKEVYTVFVNTDGDVFAGGEFGMIMIDAQTVKNMHLTIPEQPYIRQVSTNDSVYWGGYQVNSLRPKTLVEGINLPAGSNYIRVDFSVANSLLVSPVQYRYRRNYGMPSGDTEWSKWSTQPYVDYKSLTMGNYKLEIQARDSYGRVSKISQVEWFVEFPFYLKPWAILIYVIFIIGLGNVVFRWRTNRLKKEKEKLEGLVKDRTSALSDALDNLKKTQDSLVRMERTATAGKLTQGLIDRILNPINYINNFSKLTSGLAKDLREDIEEEKENMSKDNFEDCEDIIGMMTQNLGKIEEHGVATTRTLRSMEAILNTHVGTLTPQNISHECQMAVKVVMDYHKDLISKMGIRVTAQVPEDPVVLDLDAEAMSRILLSMMTNSVYSIEKKYDQTPFNPEVTLIVEDLADSVRLTVHDNGEGIEDAIKDKIFDPFFTTKPTGVASGVGLYLVRELVHDHNATIELDSERGSYCNFIITFPK